MKKICLLFCLLLSSCASDPSRDGSPSADDEPAASRLLYPYESSIQCKGCHADQYQQYEESMHAKAFTNPLFNAQYFNDVVPRALRNPGLVSEARTCIACHAPVAFMNYSGLISTPAQASRFETGVTCDFCHTLGGYAENGDFQQVASGKKQGPFQTTGASTFHSEYSGFVQVGDFCGRCHNATNHIGVEVKSTYYEWRESSYGKRGFACQECHMNKNGFLRNGNAEFERGQAAHMNIGNISKKQKEQGKLYNHSFPGAHSISQLQDALPLDFKIGSKTADADGRFPFALLVNNERSGHKMPSGSSDLRFMWLVVNALSEAGEKIPVVFQSSMSAIGPDYSIAGSSPDDATILQNDVPSGARVYRVVLVNNAGRQSLYQYDAVKNTFDNRLDATEIRKEGYYLKLPANFSGKVNLEANLYYRGAPSSFTSLMQVADFSPVLVASKKKQITIETTHASQK
ncbi:MAG: multiheme c-type cytochrome [Desulfuromonadales bacterium]